MTYPLGISKERCKRLPPSRVLLLAGWDCRQACICMVSLLCCVRCRPWLLPPEPAEGNVAVHCSYPSPCMRCSYLRAAAAMYSQVKQVLLWPTAQSCTFRASCGDLSHTQLRVITFKGLLLVDLSLPAVGLSNCVSALRDPTTTPPTRGGATRTVNSAGNGNCLAQRPQ